MNISTIYEAPYVANNSKIVENLPDILKNNDKNIMVVNGQDDDGKK